MLLLLYKFMVAVANDTVIVDSIQYSECDTILRRKAENMFAHNFPQGMVCVCVLLLFCLLFKYILRAL